MVKKELIKRSPLRIFEKAMHGGLSAGEICVLASRKGVGKTACLVHIATDKLMQGKRVIHVSFAAKVAHIVRWYEDIFKEIAKKKDLENAIDIHDEIIKNRVIMNFSQEGVKTEQVLRSLELMIRDGGFAAETIIFDGYELSKASREDLLAIQGFAKRINLEVWFSASLKAPEPVFDENGVPTELLPYLPDISVLITLRYVGKYVHIYLIKDRETFHTEDMQLILDPKTLLVTEEE